MTTHQTLCMQAEVTPCRPRQLQYQKAHLTLLLSSLVRSWSNLSGLCLWLLLALAVCEGGDGAW